MAPNNGRNIFMFILGMFTFAVGYFIVTTFVLVEHPSPEGIIEDWDQICFWLDEGGLYAAVSPKGCFSTTCTAPKFQAGTAIIDTQSHKIQLETRFVVAKTSRFPLPCTDNCSGGGTVQFKLDRLVPSDYEVWFRDERVGAVKVFSGRPTPRQCFENN